MQCTHNNSMYVHWEQPQVSVAQYYVSVTYLCCFAIPFHGTEVTPYLSKIHNVDLCMLAIMHAYIRIIVQVKCWLHHLGTPRVCVYKQINSKKEHTYMNVKRGMGLEAHFMTSPIVRPSETPSSHRWPNPYFVAWCVYMFLIAKCGTAKRFGVCSHIHTVSFCYPDHKNIIGSNCKQVQWRGIRALMFAQSVKLLLRVFRTLRYGDNAGEMKNQAIEMTG